MFNTHILLLSSLTNSMYEKHAVVLAIIRKGQRFAKILHI